MYNLRLIWFINNLIRYRAPSHTPGPTEAFDQKKYCALDGRIVFKVHEGTKTPSATWKGKLMILVKRTQKLAAYLRKLGYDAHVRKNAVKVYGEVNDNDLATVDIPMSDLEVIRKATETKIIPRDIQAFV